MPEVTFGSAEETPGANKGDEPVVNEPIIEEDGNRMTVTVTPEQAEAVKQMLAENKAAEEKEEEAKPEWQGDFKTPEELRKAYDELRTKMSKGEEKPAAEATAEETKAVEDAELDMDKYVKEYGVNKSLTDESYKELAEAGLSKEIVDGYIAGEMAKVSSATADLAEVAGGTEEYATLLEWGRTNLPAETQQAYDDLLNGGHFEAAKLALRGFVHQYTEAVGSEPGGINAGGQDGGTGAVQGFTNKSDMIAAINDPRYKNGDKAYVAEVEKRMLASDF
jgi:hypothetical protein